jgi:hypothetical protein
LPIPTAASSRFSSAALKGAFHDWGWDTDEYETSEWIPWWAPRCLIAHWYIPFTCQCVRLPDDKAAEVRALQLGEPKPDNNTYFDVIEEFLTPPHIAESKLFHRLPVWLIILPLPNKLVPCLYAATRHPGGFYPGQKYPLRDNSLHPFFVASIGPTLAEDAVYLPEAEDEYDTFYVLASPTEISATGARVDDSITNFQRKLTRELPEWLEEQAVQRFLKLTPESDTAMSFDSLPGGSSVTKVKAAMERSSGQPFPTRPRPTLASGTTRRCPRATQRSHGYYDRRHYEGDRLAAALGPRLLCRRGAQEARLNANLG